MGKYKLVSYDDGEIVIRDRIRFNTHIQKVSDIKKIMTYTNKTIVRMTNKKNVSYAFKIPKIYDRIAFLSKLVSDRDLILLGEQSCDWGSQHMTDDDTDVYVNWEAEPGQEIIVLDQKDN